MGEEEKNKETEEKSGLSFKTHDDLTKYLMNLETTITNLQQEIDKLAPKEEIAEETEEKTEETEETTEEEISEIDKLLQTE